MSYLISQYWLWLLFALALGLIVGWMTCSRQPRQWGLMPLAAGRSRAVPCQLPAHRQRHPGALDRERIADVHDLSRRLLPRLLAEGRHGAGHSGSRHGTGSCQRATVREAAVVVPPAKPAAPAAPKVEGEDLIAGKRPLGLLAPRGGKADDLKLVKGIGKQNEGRLHGLGIWHFDQIADWTSANVEWVGSYLAFPAASSVRAGWSSAGTGCRRRDGVRAPCQAWRGVNLEG